MANSVESLKIQLKAVQDELKLQKAQAEQSRKNNEQLTQHLNEKNARIIQLEEKLKKEQENNVRMQKEKLDLKLREEELQIKLTENELVRRKLYESLTDTEGKLKQLKKDFIKKMNVYNEEKMYQQSSSEGFTNIQRQRDSLEIKNTELKKKYEEKVAELNVLKSGVDELLKDIHSFGKNFGFSPWLSDHNSQEDFVTSAVIPNMPIDEIIIDGLIKHIPATAVPSLGTELGFSLCEISHLKANHPNDIEGAIKSMLIKWKTAVGDEATTKKFLDHIEVKNLCEKIDREDVKKTIFHISRQK